LFAADDTTPQPYTVVRPLSCFWLAPQATPIPVIAEQPQHADTRMTERHYAHASYVADAIRAFLPFA